MNLDDLIADAMKRKKEKPKRASRAKPDDAYRATKEELRKLQLDQCVPVSIHLKMTEQICECGESFCSVNCTPLVKCVSKTVTHYRPQEVIHGPEYDMLPRYIHMKRVEIPYCETCFANARYVEEP